VKGAYNYTIIIYDVGGNTINSTIIFTVTDQTNPTITDVSNIPDYIEGTTGNSISWTITDNYPAEYNITVNSVLLSNTTWTSSLPLVINIDGLSTGVYNYTIIAWDQSGNFIIDSVIVTVNDETAPSFNLVPDLSSYIETTTGHDLVWNVLDLHPAYYNLTRNGDYIENANWISNQDISINIDGLPAGVYNFTFHIYDLSNNSITNWIVVEVLDTEFPFIVSRTVTNEIETDTIEFDTNDNFVTWQATDLHPATWYVSRNDRYHQDGIWINNGSIRVNIDNLEVGYYNFTIFIKDESGNEIIDWIEIRVKDPLIIDTNRPQFEIEPIVFEGDIDRVTGSWTTLAGADITNATITAELRQGSLLIHTVSGITFTNNGTYIIPFNYTGVIPGISYTWNVTFSKDGYQTWANLSQNCSIRYICQSDY
jgi:hypothetical protein